MPSFVALANTPTGLILLSVLSAIPVLASPAVKSVKIIGTNLTVNLATQEGRPPACSRPLEIEVGEGGERRRREDYEEGTHRAASSAAARSNRPSYRARPTTAPASPA